MHFFLSIHSILVKKNLTYTLQETVKNIYWLFYWLLSTARNNAATAGNVLPSTNSKNAPPPVDI